MSTTPSVAVRIPSDSMEPTYLKGTVLVGRFGFRAERWDAIGFRHYLDEHEFELMRSARNASVANSTYDSVRMVMGPPQAQFLSRVVALEGETIEVRQDGVYVDGVLSKPPRRLQHLSEPRGFQTSAVKFAADPYLVPPDCVFLLNDNRARVTDSRLFGPILIGQITARLVSTSEMAKLSMDVKEDLEWFAGSAKKRPSW